MRRRRPLALLVLVLGALPLGSCTDTAPETSYNSATVATSFPTLPTVPPESMNQGRPLSARIAVDAFAGAGLPVTGQRDTTESCVQDGCQQMITTDALGVMSFLTDVDAGRYAHGRRSDVFQASRVVLRYDVGSSGTVDRSKYEAALTKLVADCRGGSRCRA